MELSKAQTTRGRKRYLILTDSNPKTGSARGLILDAASRNVQRVPSVPALLRFESWQPLTKNDPTLDALVEQFPALRPYRGIEISLPSGVTAWVRWRQWTSADPAVQSLLTETTGQVTVPAYEPDGDYFLAAQAVAALGGQVKDTPRSVFPAGSDAY